jgi:hypothetical protein
MVNVDILLLYQQSHNTAAHGAAISGANVTVEVIPDIGFYFSCLSEHVGKLRIFRFVKPIIGGAYNIKIWFQQWNNTVEISFPMAAGAGEQKNCWLF